MYVKASCKEQIYECSTIYLHNIYEKLDKYSFNLYLFDQSTVIKQVLIQINYTRQILK
jgi:hypothetical protein